MTQHVAHRASDEIATLRAEIDRLRKALEWYASSEAWETDGDQGWDNDRIIEIVTTTPSDALVDDRGNRALAALTEQPK